MKFSFKKLITNKFIRDFIINAAASALPVVLLQFLIEPLMSSHMISVFGKDAGEETFGLMITVVSLFTMLATIFGNSLNNALLIKHKEIDNGRRDYNIIFIAMEVLTIASLMLVLTLVYHVYDPMILGLIGVVGISSTFFSYCAAQFRMDFKYHLFLFCELGKCAGYGLGFLLFKVTNNWVYVFLIGSILETVLCFIFTRIWKYPYKTSKYFKAITFATLFILGSSLTASLVNYFDKLILYPMMGGDSVSIYNTATIIAKGLSLVTTPLGAVLLGYLVKRKFLTVKQLLIMLIAFTVLIIPFFFGFYYAAKWILPYMYPDYYEEAFKLLVFTTLFAIVNIYISMCEPILLTHNGERISLYYGIGKAGISILFSFIGIWVDGLYGFCIFRFISMAVSFAILFVLLIFRSRRLNREPQLAETANEEETIEEPKEEEPSIEETPDEAVMESK